VAGEGAEAVAVMMTLPFTLPVTGAVIETVGGVVSAATEKVIVVSVKLVFPKVS